jgi:hypothetical protein
MAEHIEKQLSFRYSHIEELAKLYLADSGLRADEVELVENRQSDGITTWYFRKRQ